MMNYICKLLYRLANYSDIVLAGVKRRALFGGAFRGLAIARTTVIKYPGNIKIGNNVLIGPYSCLGALSNITIGDNVRISRGVTIETASLDLCTGIPYNHKGKSIVISDNVWLATNVIVLSGVTIGVNSIISAGTIVRKDVPSNVILFPDGSIKELR